MDIQHQKNTLRLLLAVLLTVLLVVLLAVMVVAVVMIDFSAEQGNRLSDRFDYDLQKHKKIDPLLIRYRQTGRIPVAMQHPRAIAVGPEDRIYVAGDQSIHVFDPDGTKRSEITLDRPPRCLAVGRAEHSSPGRLFVGVKDHVEVYRADGRHAASWDSLGERAVLTSIATSISVGRECVFVADAGNKIVLHYDTAGKLLGQIGRRDKERNIPGFVVPSPYFDVATAPDGLLRVTNPGRHRVEAYTIPRGDLELVWGKPSLGIEGFCGCCNPANIAVLPDGRIVTAEKGIPRVKVYRADGQFDCVVAGPETLATTPTITEETRSAHKLPVVDLAADSHARVLVLDPAMGIVRIFEKKSP